MAVTVTKVSLADELSRAAGELNAAAAAERDREELAETQRVEREAAAERDEIAWLRREARVLGAYRDELAKAGVDDKVAADLVLQRGVHRMHCGG